MSSNLDLQVLRLAKKGVLRPRDLEANGIPRARLYALRKAGHLEQIARGLYQVTDASVTEHHGLAAVSKRVPHGVVCLLSALRVHHMTTQAPHKVWLAIDRKSRKPSLDYPPVRIVRMSGKVLTSGVETLVVEGVSVRVFNPAKTVADCFRYRNKIGTDIAIEALRDFRERPDSSLDELWRFARTCRVATVMRPYLESIA